MNISLSDGLVASGWQAITKTNDGEDWRCIIVPEFNVKLIGD